MLNNRLQCIANCVPKGAKVIDVGCDHAYLAIKLIVDEIAEAVVASDVVSGPVAAAQKNITKYGLQNKIKVIQANGVQGIQPAEVDCIIIAGMGAGVIIEILEAGKAVLQECKTLVLQPMVGVELIRTWLAENYWQITAEHLVEDNEILYEIIVAKPSKDKQELSLREKYFGKLESELLFPRYRQELIAKQEKIQASLKKARPNECVRKKYTALEELLQTLKEG